MHKIIHSKFQLDLTSYKVSTVEDNHWFSDQFFTKYSFPFDIYLTDELIKIFGDLLDDTNILVETYFEVQYVFENNIETAILEIESQNGLILSATIRYGFDELPNWNKKLTELPLEETVIADVYEHAKTIIWQTWPAVNYNYPQIHTDKYDITEEVWGGFKEKINNYVSGEFLVNVATTSSIINRNIMQPMPYLLHILTVAFSDAGYTLKGDITTDELLKKMCLFADVDYFKRLNENEIDVLIEKNDYVTFVSPVANYYKEINLKNTVRYKVTGVAKYVYLMASSEQYSFLKISYKGANLFFKEQTSYNRGFYTYNIEFEFETDGLADPTQILKFEAKSGYDYRTGIIFDVKIEKILESGEKPIDEIQIYNEVNLKNTVPNITVGNLISVLKNWFNLTLEVSGKDIYMNFIENEINYNNAENLSEYEELKPSKEFNSNESFLLKYDEIDNEDYDYGVVFQNKEGIDLSEDNTDKNTNPIQINALPLPQKSISGIETAYAFENGGSEKIYAVLYNGLNADNLNLTLNNSELQLLAIHEKHYNKWFNFRINAITYKWSFKMFAENVAKIYKKVFAYNRYHVVKSINKTQIAEDLFEVEIETDTLT